MKAVANEVQGQSIAAEEALRLIVDTTPALIHTGRPDGYLDYFKRQWLDFLGRSLEQVCGWRWTDSIHPDDVAGKLAEGEFVVYGNDHRGHGLTAKPSQSFGEFGPGGFDQLVEDMVSLRIIAKGEHPGKPYILLGHSLGSFAAQQFALEHSHSINGLALSGSGALDGLARTVQNVPMGENPMRLMNAPFEPARTPFDWLSRDSAEVDAFINDPLCFPSLKPESMQSFVDAFPRLADPKEIRKVRDDLPIYIFSGADDPVGQRLEGVRILIDRYRSAGLTSIAHDFYSGGRHEMLHEKNRRDVFTNLLVWIAGILERPS